MKKIAIYYFSLAAIVGGSLASCQDDDQGFDEATVRDAAVKRQYAKNFENRYGKIDPEHNWGFGPISGSNDLTRGNTNVEKNLWESKYHLEIPGWPDSYNNEYHAAGNGDNLDKGWYSSKPDASKYLPAGDVTDYEIQYVSWYFRTHDVGRVPIHCSDYFIQEISSDNDRDKNGNVITKQPIYASKQAYEDGEDPIGYENVSTWGLEMLHAKNFEGVTSADASLEGYDHINNFNQNASNNFASQGYAYVGSDENKSFTNDGKSMNATHHRMIQFFATSGTEDFQAKCSQSTGVSEADTWIDDWALVHLTFTDPDGREYDGYYLGFDYSCVKYDAQNGKYTCYERDYRYSNWIFKLTPATPKQGNGFSKRIMCEDLGNTYDFDFNDVVFDVTYNITQDQLDQFNREGKYFDYANYLAPGPYDELDVTVVVRASGGTLPIYIGDKTDSKYEAHYLLGQQDKQGNPVTEIPVNVGERGTTGPIATYHIKTKSADPNDINIQVVGKDGLYNINPVRSGNLDHYNDGNRVPVGDEKYSIAPQKFAVPVGVRWMLEMEFIENGYGYFDDWVGDRNFKDSKFNAPWYDNVNISDESLLYTDGDTGITIVQ